MKMRQKLGRGIQWIHKQSKVSENVLVEKERPQDNPEEKEKSEESSGTQ